MSTFQSAPVSFIIGAGTAETRDMSQEKDVGY